MYKPIKKRYSIFSSILRAIQNGRFQVKFKEFRFGAYNSEDEHIFDIIKDGKIIGEFAFLDLTYLELNTDNIRFTTDNGENYIWLFDYGTEHNEKMLQIVRNIFYQALFRDDKEYCAVMSNGKELYLPIYINDVEREEVLAVKDMDFSIDCLPFLHTN